MVRARGWPRGRAQTTRDVIPEADQTQGEVLRTPATVNSLINSFIHNSPLHSRSATIHTSIPKSNPRTVVQSTLVNVVELTTGKSPLITVTDGADSAQAEVVQIYEDDVEDEVTYWRYTLMGSVLGGKPKVQELEAYVKKYWLNISAPILFPHLDPFLWSSAALSRLASKIGKPLFADLTTTCKAKLSFARVMVEVDISKSLPEEVCFSTPYHDLISQKIIYEWMPYYYEGCKKLGHTKDFCRLNKAKAKQTQVYQPIVTRTNPPSSVVGASECSELDPTPSVQGVLSSSTGIGVNSECVQLGSPPSQGSDLPPHQNVEGSECQKLGPNTAGGRMEIHGVKCIIRAKTSSGTLASSNTFGILSEFPGMKVILLPADMAHYNGRIWVFWDPRTITINATIINARFVHCELTHNATNQIDTTIVYGYNTTRDREDLWLNLLGLAHKTENWAILGDFNIVRDISEKIGPNPPKLSEIHDFNDCIRGCQLDDLVANGCEFTWTNKHTDGTRVSSILGKVLVNSNWLLTFLGSIVNVLLPGLSDHYPLLLNVFEEQACFFKKLSAVRQKLTQLHKTYYTGLSLSVREAEDNLRICQQSLSLTPTDSHLIAEEAALLTTYKSLQKAELEMLHQKAKVHSINLNDCSSAFFYAKIATRKQQSIVGQICNHHGDLITGVNNVNIAFVDYYNELLGTKHAVQKTGKLVKQANVTVLALIPKKDVVSSVKDFRPIACCIVLYKTISKIMV
ncbi:uncharacterized protein LOC141607506 [Silene latifolia]|uniref:uncharacterized protein LOC141607506 n=1 Tax=Silene latifolia TaxID=37657 RepID=UPI003D77D021